MHKHVFHSVFMWGKIDVKTQGNETDKTNHISFSFSILNLNP